jgi:hypothetical protein
MMTIARATGLLMRKAAAEGRHLMRRVRHAAMERTGIASRPSRSCFAAAIASRPRTMTIPRSSADHQAITQRRKCHGSS